MEKNATLSGSHRVPHDDGIGANPSIRAALQWVIDQVSVETVAIVRGFPAFGAFRAKIDTDL